MNLTTVSTSVHAWVPRHLQRGFILSSIVRSLFVDDDQMDFKKKEQRHLSDATPEL